MDDPKPMPPLEVPLTDAERAVLQSASAAAGSPIDTFVRERALEAAHTELLERRRFSIPAERWDAFVGKLFEPSDPDPAALARLRRKPVWND